MAGISKVYGDSSRIKSCEFHFKDHRNQKARLLESESASEFKILCDGLLESTTTEGYDTVKKKMDVFISAKEDRAFLKSWVSWWHDRRGFIFRAFAPKDAPQMNQAEVIHAGWTHRDRQNLSLLDACQADVRDSLLLDVELKQYQSGSAQGGTGPFAVRERYKHVRALQKAKRLGKEMFSNEENGMLIDPQSSHRPRDTTNRQQKTKQKRKQPTSSNTGGSLQHSLVSAPSQVPTASSASTATYSQPTLQQFPSNASYFSTQSSSLPLPPINPIARPSMQYQVPVQNPPPFLSLHSANNSSGNAFRAHFVPWHSGMSPNRYEVVLLSQAVKKCYGCGSPFTDKFRKSPHNIVIKHVDRRVVGKNDLTGQLIYSNDYTNTYYHLSVSHVKKKNPLFTGLVYISSALHQSLDSGQLSTLNSCGLNIIVQ